MKHIYIRCTNHFDPVWRRAFKKDFVYNGKTYSSHSKIEELCIKEWLDMAMNSDCKFDVECSLVLRNYIENNPKDIEKFKKLLKEGKFELLGSGEIIPDPNMPRGETLVRNLVYGFLWYNDVFGELPQIGCMFDGFGASAQLPQLFRKCGIKWLIGLSYSYPTKDYWKGLDGSCVYINQDGIKNNIKIAQGAYYPPCPECDGKGCETCDNSGIDVNFFRSGGEITADGLDFDNYDFGVIRYGGEETLVKKDLPEAVRKAEMRDDNHEYKFIILRDLLKYYKEKIECVDNPPSDKLSPEIEGGPNSSGCLVSRIKIKQNVRRLEGIISAYEKLCVLIFADGKNEFKEKFKEIWKDIIFCSFHDSITGTMIDAGYDEVNEVISNADKKLLKIKDLIVQNYIECDEKTITVFNHHSFPVTNYVNVVLKTDKSVRIYDENDNEMKVYSCTRCGENMQVKFLVENIPALSATVYHYSENTDVVFEGKADIIENEFYLIETDHHGITSIYDKQENRELVMEGRGYVNELILENDIGDPWATRELDRTRTRLGSCNKLESVKKNQNYSEIIYNGKFVGNEDVFAPKDYRVMILEWKQTVRLYDGIKRIEFKTDINWNTFDRRIRISFPMVSDCKDDIGSYAVPYGTVERDIYYMSRTGWNNANGDYPAVEWGATGAKSGLNIALLNKGTPSYRIERGELLLSVLRSPTFPNCLCWPQFYDAPVYNGMRDQGQHSFEYAITSFNGKWQDNNIVEHGYQYNEELTAFNGQLKLSPDKIKLIAENVIITAMKFEEKGSGIVVRLLECKGKSSDIQLYADKKYTAAYETDLLEQNVRRIDLIDGKLNANVQPYEIKTIKFV